MTSPMIAGRVFNTPLMVEPRKAAAFLQGFGDRILGSIQFDPGPDGAPTSGMMQPRPQASILDDGLGESIRSGDRSGYALRDGAAIIPVTGVLVHRGEWVGRSSGQTSYEGLRAQIDAAAADHRVRGIALEIDCYGGEVAGCFDLADRIREVRSIKPVRAFVAEHAYSAAYALASQAEHITVARTGGVGSIGVVCMHADYETALEQAGIKVTMIHAGAHKVDGNPYQHLPESVRADLQSRMENLRGIFCAIVGEGRGQKLSPEGARATEARCLDAADAVAAGLADAVAEPRAAFSAFIEKLNAPGGSLRSGVTIQTSETKGAHAMGEDTSAEVTDENLEDQANDAVDDGSDADQGDGSDVTDSDDATDPDGASASTERERIAAILNSAEASGRGILAKHLAFSTDMDAAAAIAILGKAAKEGGSGALSNAMSGTDPDIDEPDENAGASRRSMKDVHAARTGDVRH